MPAKLTLPENEIAEMWLGNTSLNAREISKVFACSPSTITAILNRSLDKNLITERKKKGISYSASQRTDFGTEEHRQRCVYASSCVTPEGKKKQKKGLLKGAKISAQNRKGKSLSIERCEQMSLSRLGRHKGGNHPNWKGGTSKICWRGTGWRRSKRECRERDEHICQLCLITPEKQGRQMDVHHIKSFFDFDDAKEANKLTNLISLCRSCHHRVEANKISLFR